uniref:Hox cluster protein ShxC n=1 Tax=Callimorpha dominula TaxID=938182 RepID=A0A060DCM0_9NEOP|nr:Hox cluster protein ShxC [Callimorpha dominula]
MLQNMIITAFTPLGYKREINSWENQPFTMAWPEKNQQISKDITVTIKKKPRRVRTAFTTDQIRTLERTFSRYKYITTERRKEMAKSLEIDEKCIKIWFQNRRMKEKRVSSESSCDSSCESFSSESVSLSTSPPTQTINEDCKTDYTTQYRLNSNSSEYSYQLPSYYGMNEIAPSMYGMQSHNVSAFHNDSNIYPTHYYPYNVNYTSVESNPLNNYYDNDMNHQWASNHNEYYAPI